MIFLSGGIKKWLKNKTGKINKMHEMSSYTLTGDVSWVCPLTSWQPL